MVTIDRLSGFRVVIYVEDHPPPHVHVQGDGEVKIHLVGSDGEPEIVKNRNMKLRDASRALRLVQENQLAYLRLWKTMHG